MDKIRLTEEDLHRIVKESVKNVIAENGMEEGWWNQARSAGKTAWNGLKNTVSGDETLGGAWEKTKKNWKTQREVDNLTGVANLLYKLVDSGKLDPQMTVAQLIRGKGRNNGSGFGKLAAMASNRRGQISRRGGASY